MMNKYILSNKTKYVNGVLLLRIRAFRDIPSIGVKFGDLGGFVETTNNLSQFGTCWIHNDACVYGNAIVKDNSQVKDYSKVFGNVEISDNAILKDSCVVYSNSKVSGNAIVGTNARVKYNVNSGYCLNVVLQNYLVSYCGMNDSLEHMISVGCKVRSIAQWNDTKIREDLIIKNNFPRENIEMFEHILSIFNSIYNTKEHSCDFN